MLSDIFLDIDIIILFIWCNWRRVITVCSVLRISTHIFQHGYQVIFDIRFGIKIMFSLWYAYVWVVLTLFSDWLLQSVHVGHVPVLQQSAAHGWLPAMHHNAECVPIRCVGSLNCQSRVLVCVNAGGVGGVVCDDTAGQTAVQVAQVVGERGSVADDDFGLCHHFGHGDLEYNCGSQGVLARAEVQTAVADVSQGACLLSQGWMQGGYIGFFELQWFNKIHDDVHREALFTSREYFRTFDKS